MRVLIDGDMPCHEIGHIQVETGKSHPDGTKIKRLLDKRSMLKLLKGSVQSIILHSEAGGYKIFTTRGKTFRDKLATIARYKGNREHAERDGVDILKDYIEDTYDCETLDGYEADDAMAMWQWGDLLSIADKHGWETPEDWDESILMEQATTVIATRDKDLDTVPGWHWKWWVSTSNKRDGTKPTEEEFKMERGEAYWIGWTGACRNFYTQMLMGDRVDNIKGLYNVGEKSAWVKQLKDMDNEDDMHEHVLEKYNKYFHQYAMPFFIETGRLLWMCRRKKDEWKPVEQRDEDYWK